jgi:hypothetical protein
VGFLALPGEIVTARRWPPHRFRHSKEHIMSNQADPAAARRRSWRIVGSLALAHIVLMLAGFTFQRVARLGDAPSTVLSVYRGSPAGAAGFGGAVSLLGFVAFLFAATLLAQLLRGRTDMTRWLAGLVSTAGATYVGITLGVAFAGSDAARYGAHRAWPATTVAAVGSLHWFGVFMATAILGVFTVTLAARLWVTGLLPRWVALGGFAAGACCLAAAAVPPEDIVDDATLVWMVWFVALGVAALRVRPRETASTAVPAAAA